MISWKLSIDNKVLSRLFKYGNYFTDIFICKCGHHEFIVRKKSQALDYCCIECENEEYFDTNLLNNQIELFMKKYKSLNGSYLYDFIEDSEKISSIIYIRIPNKFNEITHKIIYDRLVLYSLTLLKNGDLKEYIAIEIDEIFIKKAKNILEKNFQNSHFVFKIPLFKDKDYCTKKIQFFLKNCYLKEYDLWYLSGIEKIVNIPISVDEALIIIMNNRSEKTIKKAIITLIANKIKNNTRVYVLHIYVFTRIFEDSNILLMLLELDFTYINNTNLDFNEFKDCLMFLKQLYSEKQLFRLFQYINSNNYSIKELVDLVNEYIFYKKHQTIEFEKVKCNLLSIHDEFIRCNSLKRYKLLLNIKFNYKYEQKRACMLLDKYIIKLPTTGHELWQWGENLQNCISSYAFKISTYATAIYGFFIDDDLKFVVELEYTEIVQASGYKNRLLTNDEKIILNQWENKLLFEIDYNNEEIFYGDI